jgi:hypothetical protein
MTSPQRRRDDLERLVGGECGGGLGSVAVIGFGMLALAPGTMHDVTGIQVLFVVGVTICGLGRLYNRSPPWSSSRAGGPPGADT